MRRPEADADAGAHPQLETPELHGLGNGGDQFLGKPRGQREICTLKDRPILPGRDRARDAYSALAWLAGRDDVDPKSIHVMGWSNGGSTVLNTVRANAPGHTADSPQFRSAVAFYPGCTPLGRTPYKPIAPLLIQTGAADDWTPAKPCEELAEAARKRGADVQIDVYPGAHHAFDGLEGKVRTRAGPTK